MKKFILIIPVLTIFWACQKKDNTTPDTSKLVITVTSPEPNQTIKQGDTVSITATASYASELHGYEVRITNKADNSVVFTTEDHLHSDHVTIQEQWVDMLSQAADLKLEITVEIDHNGNEGHKEVDLKSIP